ncbi:transposable element Tcb1 transposase [Trichonephila clavipes]|nr:transposable element Tcb1 transposase [Trichonephila clavipes]
MQEGKRTNVVDRIHQLCTTSSVDRQIVRMAVTDRSATSRTVAHHIESVTHNSVSARTSRVVFTNLFATPRWLDSSLETPWREDAEQLHYAPPHWSCTGYYGLGGIGYLTRTPLVRIAGTLNSQRYISEVLNPVDLPYLQGLATSIFQQDNARPHVVRIVQRFFINHQIELLPWPARSPDLSPIENMWSMVAQRLTQITPQAATPEQLWKRAEASWSACDESIRHFITNTVGRLWGL